MPRRNGRRPSHQYLNVKQLRKELLQSKEKR